MANFNVILSTALWHFSFYSSDGLLISRDSSECFADLNTLENHFSNNC